MLTSEICAVRHFSMWGTRSTQTKESNHLHRSSRPRKTDLCYRSRHHRSNVYHQTNLQISNKHIYHVTLKCCKTNLALVSLLKTDGYLSYMVWINALSPIPNCCQVGIHAEDSTKKDNDSKNGVLSFLPFNKTVLEQHSNTMIVFSCSWPDKLLHDVKLWCGPIELRLIHCQDKLVITFYLYK